MGGEGERLDCDEVRHQALHLAHVAVRTQLISWGSVMKFDKLCSQECSWPEKGQRTPQHRFQSKKTGLDPD